MALGNLDPCQLVALIEVDGNQAALADIDIGVILGSFDDALSGDHDIVPVIRSDIRGFDDAGNLFVLLQREDIDHIGAAGGAGAFRNFVALNAVDLALVGEEHEVIVGRAGVDVADKILVPTGHAADSASAAALGSINIQRLALQIAVVGEGDHAGFLRNQVLDIHFALNRSDFGAARVVEFFFDFEQLGLDDCANLALVCEDCVILCNLLMEFVNLCLELFTLQACQTAQLHLDDCLCLNLVESEALHQGCLTVLNGVVGADDRDDLVDIIQSGEQTLEDMSAFLCLFQVKDGSAGDNLLLELDVFLEHLVQGEGLWLVVDQSEHNHADGILKLGEAIQLVEHNLSIGIAFELDDNLHALSAGLIADIADLVNLLFLDQLGNPLD